MTYKCGRCGKEMASHWISDHIKEKHIIVTFNWEGEE